jgi:outer membrane protein assembly factor BamB
LIFALNSSNGKLIWEQRIEERHTKPEVSKDIIFTGSNEGLKAKNKKSGINKWEKNLGKITSKPIIGKDSVISGFSDGAIYAFDTDSGEEKWSYKLPASVEISELHENVFYACSENTCYAFDIVNQEVKWRVETDGVITAAPLVKENTVYFGSWDGKLYAIDTKNGEVKWIFETGWGIDSIPAVSDDLVFVGSMDNNFYAIDKENGYLKWFFTCLSAIHSSPVIYGEYVFFGSDDGRFYALNKDTGSLEWDFAPGFFIKDDDVNNFITTPILSDPLVENGIVYISSKGNVYALDAQTFEIHENIQEKKDKSIPLFMILILILGVLLIIRPFFKTKNSKNKK